MIELPGYSVVFLTALQKGVVMMARYEFDGIETKNLILRKFKESDIKKFYAYRNHPEIRRYQGEGWCDCTLEKAKEFIKEQATMEPRKPKQWFSIAIERKSTNELIGDLGIYTQGSEDTQIQMFVTITPEYQKEGYALEAMEATLDYVFEKLDVDQVIAIIDIRNRAAVKLLERLKFEIHGDFTTGEEIDGEDITEHLFTITKNQWVKRESS